MGIARLAGTWLFMMGWISPRKAAIRALEQHGRERARVRAERSSLWVLWRLDIRDQEGLRPCVALRVRWRAWGAMLLVVPGGVTCGLPGLGWSGWWAPS